MHRRPGDNGGDDAIGDASDATQTGSTAPTLTGSRDRRFPVRSHPIGIDARYEDRGLIGRGGMGQVRRVYDRTLGRTVAMKILGMELMDSELALDRFVLEAGITAGLQHPGIVPVHNSGRLADGRQWYTMREVQGRTLAEVIEAVHRAGASGEWGTTPDGWTIRRLLEALLRATEAMAYAHEEGIIHRDIKPHNIMVGGFGEVQVMDWGLAQRIALTTGDPPAADGETAPMPRIGPVAGTPAYMAPEQAIGLIDLTRAVDVYALGGVLYQILTGAPPFIGSAQSVWRSTIEGPPSPVRTRVASDHPDVPGDLIAICDRAMARETDARYAHAGEMAEALRAYLEGARRREQAETVLTDAAHLRPRARELRAKARELHAAAETRVSVIASFDPIETRHEAWGIAAEAAELDREATLIEVQWEQQVRAALTQVPDLFAAHIQLAAFYRERMEEAEALRQPDAATRFEALLRIHDRGHHAAFLRGDGALTVHTEPPGARAELFRVTPVHRRLVPERIRGLGRTPIDGIPLERGSYIVRLTLDGHAPVEYPVFIERGAHWDGVRPGGTRPHPIRMPRLDEIDADEVYVPAGWFVAGGDPEAAEGLPRQKVWVDGFMARRFATTQAEYLTFVNALHAADLFEAVERALPRTLMTEGPSVPLFERGKGGYALPDDALDFGPRMPIVQIDWFGAVDYCAWFAEHEGSGWRLPDELEREKLTRGVDGRFYPWGDDASAPWACALGTSRRAPRYAPVDRFPTDVSPYGARGVGGNVRDWCCNLWLHDGPRVESGRLIVEHAPRDDKHAYRAIRGGGWSTNLRHARAAARYANRPQQRFTVLGVRPVRPFDID